MPNHLMSAAGLRRLVLIGAASVAGTAASAAGNPSGFYGEMLLSVRGNQVQGVYATARGIDPNGGSAPQFSCFFLLQGQLAGDRADIVSWTPGGKTVIKGSLTLSPPDARLQLQSAQDGCAMAAGDMTHEGYVLGRVSPGPAWIGVGMVGAKRAALRAKPTENTGRPPYLGFTPYLVQYDAVAILQRQSGWARVRFMASGKQPTGWLREAELTSFASWPTRETSP